jgi:sec-independent protein translocase protein TatA
MASRKIVLQRMLTMEIGTPELLIILVIILLVFGVGRISKVGSELGQGLREFRHGLKGDEDRSLSKPLPITKNEIPPAEESDNKPNL